MMADELEIANRQHFTQEILHIMRAGLKTPAWRPSRDYRAGNTSAAGAATIVFEQLVGPGEELAIDRIVISIAGTSGAAVAAFYLTQGDPATVDESQLVDFTPQFYGASPARAVSDQASPIYCFGGDVLVVKIVGAAGAQQVWCRTYGRVREVTP